MFNTKLKHRYARKNKQGGSRKQVPLCPKGVVHRAPAKIEPEHHLSDSQRYHHRQVQNDPVFQRRVKTIAGTQL